MKRSKLILLVLSLVFAGSSFAQTTTTTTTTPTAAPAVDFKIATDIVSSYVWRGVPCISGVEGVNPHFQPTFALVAGNLEIGAWGSTDFVGKYKELDLYATYTIGNILALNVTDYNWNWKNRYFNYKKKETDHIFEGSILFKGTESLPLSIGVYTMLYGNDYKWDKNIDNGDGTFGNYDKSKSNYSTYIELGYAFKKFNVFCGVTPSDGYYGDSYGNVGGFSVVNLGLSSSKEIKIADFKLPVKATLGFNPQLETAYLVFGITLN